MATSIARKLTAERFIANPFSDNPNDKLYNTGDLVRYLPNGQLDFIGRSDDQIKLRGFRIELGEIEQQLNALDGVQSSVVLLNNSEQGIARLVAYIKQQPNDSSLEIDSVKASLGEVLPDYMVPGNFLLVDQWPLTPNGKIDKKALPSLDDVVGLDDYQAPEGETEQALVAIWADLLKLEADSVGVNHDFFALGGHSLLAVRLVAEVEERFELDIGVKAVFACPTIAQQAAMLDEQLLVDYLDQDVDEGDFSCEGTL